MPRKPVEPVVEALARPLVEERGLEFVDVEYVHEHGQWYLRLYIDKEGGVGLDDCEAVSTAVGARLDDLDPIPGGYIFEVSSPGIERPLKKDSDFRRYAGRLVEVTLFAPADGEKTYVGELVGLVDGRILLRPDRGRHKGREVQFERARVARTRLYVDF